MFWKSDRWGRSAANVLTTVNELRDRGVKVVSLTENFDLETKEGRFMFAVLAAAAEYELELRAERQADGNAAAQRRQADGQMLPGKKRIGRTTAYDALQLARAGKSKETAPRREGGRCGLDHEIAAEINQTRSRRDPGNEAGETGGGRRPGDGATPSGG